MVCAFQSLGDYDICEFWGITFTVIAIGKLLRCYTEEADMHLSEALMRCSFTLRSIFMFTLVLL